MTTSPSQIVSSQLGRQYARAAPDNLMWAQEREFFQVQIRKVCDAHESLEAGVANNNERTIESLAAAARACAAMGLSMNPISKLVYFIPRRERAFNKEIDKSEAEYKAKVPWIVTADPSYMGLAWIATHHAGADDVAAEVVFKADRFIPHGPFKIPDHTPTIDNEQRLYKLAIGVYCGIRWPGGRERSEYIDAPTIALIRQLSKLPNSLMWDEKKLWTEGWKKAAVRRACKLGIQGNPRMDAAEAAMLEAEGTLVDATDRPVPRRTPANGADPQEGTPPEGSKSRQAARGMGGLRAAVDVAETHRNTSQEVVDVGAAAVGAQAPRSTDPPPEPKPGGDLFAAQGARKPQTSKSRHPEGSIEWWGEKIAATSTRGALKAVNEEAVAAGIDKSQDADAYASIYKKHSQALRARGL